MKKNIFKIKIIKFIKFNDFNFEEYKIIKSKILGRIGILNMLIKFSNLRNIVYLNHIKKTLFKILNKKKINNNYEIKNYTNFFIFKKKIEHKINKIFFYKKKIENFFIKKNFKIREGKEIEKIKNNFTFLRSYKNHPSRSKSDTFYIKNEKKMLLRTHMTSLQKKYITKKNDMIFSGKVYRKDKGSKHLVSFHQIDGMILRKNYINFNYFKNIFENLIKYIFEKKIYIRYRNSYFPFTLPSYEIDIKKKKKDKWIEVGGVGEIHENISRKRNGIAFGFGLERLIMIKNNLKNINEI
ncbi:hypothetical protein ONB66_00605 [Candidatus Vidania fulgoroideae]|uniref:phenylalanine--tRNA ligase n=1 Tax=Candidatus Vidania fulgoroideorum TaxID=881286 RepID=A0AAX3NBD4_9PROT|nr:hypothetical protein ONB67_00290 [Candidatus Vidania fulgoroideae]WDR79350.1 hypothetical protein ONB66_00605 [Candidatus Vidania fulgoroideae]